MKKMQFDKLVALTIDGENVTVNGAKLTMKDGKLMEIVKKEMPFMEHTAIADKYEKNADGKIENEADIEAYLKEIDELQAKHMDEKEVQLWIGDKNVLELIKELEAR